jgi:hypothetical protein
MLPMPEETDYEWAERMKRRILFLEQDQVLCRHAADVWKARYLALAQESLPTILWRWLGIQVARLMGK